MKKVNDRVLILPKALEISVSEDIIGKVLKITAVLSPHSFNPEIGRYFVEGEWIVYDTHLLSLPAYKVEDHYFASRKTAQQYVRRHKLSSLDIKEVH